LTRRTALGVLAAAGGFAAAAALAGAMTGQKTLTVANHASVSGHPENIVVTSSGFAVYYLTGDSAHHPRCTKANGCFGFWPPVKVSSPGKLSKASGISGALGTLHRNGFYQVTLAGRPLYTYANDKKRRTATGEGLTGFGGVWHVIKASGGGSSNTTTTTGGGGGGGWG
jgi:predicted lipoprotein with Yx(FWY)xxD motif